MDVLPDETGSDEILASEIVMTAEVASICTALGQRGVLVFGISDKPDEASIPLPADASKGYAPIHRTPMKVYGQELA